MLLSLIMFFSSDTSQDLHNAKVVQEYQDKVTSQQIGIFSKYGRQLKELG